MSKNAISHLLISNGLDAETSDNTNYVKLHMKLGHGIVTKTHRIFEYHHIPCMEIRCPLLDQGDFLDIGGETHFSMTKWVKDFMNNYKGKLSVILLDEMGNSVPKVKESLEKIVETREVNGNKIDDNVIFVVT